MRFVLPALLMALVACAPPDPSGAPEPASPEVQADGKTNVELVVKRVGAWQAGPDVTVCGVDAADVEAAIAELAMVPWGDVREGDPAECNCMFAVAPGLTVCDAPVTPNSAAWWVQFKGTPTIGLVKVEAADAADHLTLTHLLARAQGYADVFALDDQCLRYDVEGHLLAPPHLRGFDTEGM